jgi:hypothetical protein
MSKIVRRGAFVLVIALMAAGCGSSSDNGGGGSTDTTVPAEKIDYKALGLWDDGPCDTTKPELKLGLMTVFESPIVSLKDQADALTASAEAFNQRGGANGSCIKVTTGWRSRRSTTKARPVRPMSQRPCRPRAFRASPRT